MRRERVPVRAAKLSEQFSKRGSELHRGERADSLEARIGKLLLRLKP